LQGSLFKVSTKDPEQEIQDAHAYAAIKKIPFEFRPLVEKKPGINYEALRCALRPFAIDCTIKDGMQPSMRFLGHPKRTLGTQRVLLRKCIV
jgi:hypothetical protein